MSKISWSEFIIVWLAVCVVIDIVLTYLNKKHGTQNVSETEERKARIKQLYTPYRVDVTYETPLRHASMVKVAALASLKKTLPECSSVNKEETDHEELTELQKETSDIVKMLFG